jgi:hypothetical protein
VSEAITIEAPAAPFPWRRFLLGLAGVGGGALLAGGLLVFMGWLFVALSWPHRAPEGNPEWGINFECNQAEYLLLEDPAAGPAGYVSDDRPGRVAWCAGILDELLSGLGAKHVRMSVEWSEVEPQPGVYDFSLVDALLATAQAHGAKVLLSVGMKAQRHPEYYLPQWITDSNDLPPDTVVSEVPAIREAALAMATAVVQHVAPSPAIEAWTVENEPYLASARASHWTLDRDYILALMQIIRANDPQARPRILNDGGHFSWATDWNATIADADIGGVSIYPYRNWKILGHRIYLPLLELGPVAPNYPARAKAAEAAGKQLWITELQAEPWAVPDIRLFDPQHPPRDLTPAHFAQNLVYARKSGATRVYLWGAEWWLLQKERYGDARWWDIARAVLSAPG